MKVLVAQIGARRHYAVARALYRAGLLERLVTDACAELPPWRWLDGLLPPVLRPAAVRRVLARRVEEVPAGHIRGLPWFALSAAWERRRREAPTAYWARRNAAFGRLVVGRGLGNADTVYAYNAAALEIFNFARTEGRRRVLDQSAAPWRWNRRLLQEEALRWPGWEEHPAEVDVAGALSEREEAEWALADHIICGSEFAQKTLVETGGPSECCRVVPYPVPVSNCGCLSTLDSVAGKGNNVDGPAGSSVRSHLGPGEADGSPPFPRERAGRHREPLRVLFVGTLQLRKGVQYLLQAKRLLRGEGLVFRLVGPSCLSAPAMLELRSEMEVVGPVPRSEIASHYAWADVFVLPTLSEGSANVCYEALAAGLPVITTPNAGLEAPEGGDLVIVPIRDPEALAAAVCAFREEREHHLGLAEISMPARDFADYAADLVRAIGAS